MPPGPGSGRAGGLGGRFWRR
uniref:Uncharacterized protein n=1 Tax=Arundo donax TaxID=35708 RepID=A0A0A9FNB0_ARUDO